MKTASIIAIIAFTALASVAQASEAGKNTDQHRRFMSFSGDCYAQPSQRLVNRCLFDTTRGGGRG